MDNLLQNQETKGSISVSEIAEYLGVSEETVRGLLRRRKFPAIVHGKKSYIIPRVSFESWITDPERIIEFRNSYEREGDDDD